MEIKTREEGGKLIVAPSERNHTLMTVLKQGVWENDGRAGYNQGHPYEDEGGELVVEGDDPEAVLQDAIDTVRDDLEEFRDTFSDV